MDDISDDDEYYYTDDYIGHIFDTSLNNSDINNSMPYIDVQSIYNRVDTFRNKNNIMQKNYIYILKRYVFIICLLAIIFLLMIY
jgi:hypothetical protein